jgi:hypothetical protein
MLTRRQSRIALAGALALGWLGSLFLPAVTLHMDVMLRGDDFHPTTMTGAGVLWNGWIAVYYYQYAWFANLFLFAVLGLLILERARPIWLRGLAGLLILCTLSAFIDDVIGKPGFYLWGGVNLIAATAAFLFSANRLMDRNDSIRTH